ncbi:uncharacterized protein PV09_01370 [Verruconis gallopava]|uniref:Uncharacterized protein n=1 Tax=Verruconis gallopava TaxID=253628 RepID=A0A0D1Z695_9PEZI|nr:uncharacterized protein PV09_01370 [Verruconis gallopava]KIW08467.1 hypothetical protein PV09_01370 [Verruconis gallopava]
MDYMAVNDQSQLTTCLELPFEREKRDAIYKLALFQLNNANPSAADPTKPRRERHFSAADPGSWWPIGPQSIYSVPDIYPTVPGTRPGGGRYRGYHVMILEPSIFTRHGRRRVEEAKELFYGRGVVLFIHDVETNFINHWAIQNSQFIYKYLRIVYVRVLAQATAIPDIGAEHIGSKGNGCAACAAEQRPYEYHDVHWQQPMFELNIGDARGQELFMRSCVQLASSQCQEIQRQVQKWQLRSVPGRTTRFVGQSLLAVMEILWKVLQQINSGPEKIYYFVVKTRDVQRFEQRAFKPWDSRTCPNVVVLTNGYEWPVVELRAREKESL